MLGLLSYSFLHVIVDNNTTAPLCQQHPDRIYFEDPGELPGVEGVSVSDSGEGRLLES